MNERQKIFLDAFVEGGSLPEAARAAGYSDSYAVKVLSDPLAKEYVKEHAGAALYQRALKFYAGIVSGEITEQVVVADKMDGQTIHRVLDKLPAVKDRIRAGEIILQMVGQEGDDGGAGDAGLPAVDYDGGIAAEEPRPPEQPESENAGLDRDG
ncbi:terminase small subunit [Gehongia tenuis]|uniref:Terminase small subunit n=1 Tax=Gehongia tenuis TaxID=2763655 RepID=A0A926D2I4_9FIRM|nr:terminase small subunit [Gehongia tenuis]MBC8530558.1 hypothetical protein [Gehongia tenuis]